MSASQCPEDLLILERRGTLGLDAQRALAEHAATCELCSLSRALGRDLARDPLPALAGGETGRGTELDIDGQEQTRLALIVARTMLMRGKVMRAGSAAPAQLAPVPLPARRALPSRTPARRRRARSPRRFAVAAALLLLAGSASAALWRWSAWTIEQARIKERVAGAAAHSGRPHRHAGSAGVAVPPEDVPAPTEQPPLDEPLDSVARSEQPAPSPPVPVHVAPSPVTPRPAPQRPAAAASAKRPVPDLDARQLFVAAGQARRARNFAEAQGLYRALQAHFPGSPEATLSFLSLGDLLLSQGAVAQALAQFDAYLASGDATMAEEALVGRARTLARLGRTEEERAAWRELLSRFPQSDYRWRAQQRLDPAGDSP